MASNFWNKDEVGSAQQDQNTFDIGVNQTNIATNLGTITDIIDGTQELDILTVKGQTILARDGGRILGVGGSDDTAYGMVLGNNLKIEKDSDPKLSLRDIGTFVWDIGMVGAGSLAFFNTNGESARVGGSTLNWMLGTTVDSGPRLVVADGVGGGLPSIISSTVALFQNNDDPSDYAEITLIGGTSAGCALNMGTSGGANGFRIIYGSSNGQTILKSNDVEFMRAFNNGNVSINSASNLATLHVDGDMRVTGTLGNVITQSTGNVVELSRGGANYIHVSTSVGDLRIVTDGRALGSSTANVVFNADQSTTFNGAAGSTKIIGSGIEFDRNSSNWIHATTVGGKVHIVTNGRSATTGNSNVIFNTDQSTDFNADVWIATDCSALTFTDRTPYPETLELAYDSINSMGRLPEEIYEVDNKANQLDHSNLHDYLKGSGEDSRDMSATISCAVEVIKDLQKRIEFLESN